VLIVHSGRDTLYEYTMEKCKQLSDYNMEAQGCLLEDYLAFALARFIFICALVYAQFFGNVLASEGVASTEATSVQPPKCADFLVDIKKKPAHLEFVACKDVNLHGLAALVSEYRVVGAHAASVEAYFVKTAGMPKLRRACCGWESLPVNAKVQRLTGLYKVQETAYEVSMASGETTIGGTRAQWKKVPYFFVNVVQYLESP